MNIPTEHSMNFHNPIDDDTREELIECILGFSLFDEAELEEKEYWELQQLVKEWREECAAEDFMASCYSY
jgi:hypothetical protein